jgi:hypothetical protein
MTGPLEAVAQAITGVEIDPIDTDGGYAIPESEAYRLAALVVAALELREETREQENFPYGLEIGISCYAGQGHADCNKCNVGEYGCYADLVKWSHNHAKEKHSWTGSTFEHRWVSSWTSGSEEQ